MTVFKKEIKTHWKSLMWWSIGMMFMIYAGMAKYSAYAKSGQEVNDVFKTMPKAMMAVFGVGDVDLTTAMGFFSILMLYLFVMGAIHASLLGAGVLTEEELDRTAEFLYAKPISRSRVVTEKLFAALFNVVVLNLVTLVLSLLIVEGYNNGPSAVKGVVLMIIGLLFAQLIFMSIGMAAASILRNPKLAASAASGLMFGAYFLNVWLDISDKLAWLKYLTPFKYFDAKEIANTVKLDPVMIALSVALISLMVALTYVFYRRRDLYV
jgi:ABC-2 type transport system permease protein